jgi:hypothetical protein
MQIEVIRIHKEMFLLTVSMEINKQIWHFSNINEFLNHSFECSNFWMKIQIGVLELSI